MVAKAPPDGYTLGVADIAGANPSLMADGVQRGRLLRVAHRGDGAAAGVAMSALHWDLHGWQAAIKRKQDADPTSVAQSTFHFRWIMGCLGMPMRRWKKQSASR